MNGSWQTTILGIGAMLVALGNALVGQFDTDAATVPDWGLAVALILAGLGLWKARDNDKTSEDVGAAGRLEVKAKTPWLPVLLASLLPFCALSLPLVVAPGCTTVAAGHDPVVVNAERLTSTATDILDAYVTIELQQRDFLWKGSPEFKKVADRIRAHGLDWVESVEDTKDTYKANRSPENKLNLQAAIAVLQTAVSEAQQQIALAAAVNPEVKGY